MDEKAKQSQIEDLKKKFDELDSQIAKLQEEQDDVDNELYDLGIIKCDHCFDWFQKQQLIEYKNAYGKSVGAVCKNCYEILIKK